MDFDASETEPGGTEDTGIMGDDEGDKMIE
jgi:hypothetical protein